MAASLTQIAVTARKSIRYGIYFIILFIIGRILFGMVASLYRTVFPKPPPPPTVAFGILPALPFPAKSDLPKFEYKIETPSGGVPALATQAKIYYMPKRSTTLFSLESTKRRASGLGFSGEPEEVTPTLYRFKHPTAASTLEINIVNDTFSISYNLASDPLPLDKLPPNAQEAASVARGYLGSGQFSAIDLEGQPGHQFLKVDSQGISTALSLSEANLIKLSLFRKDYDKLPAKTADPITGNIWFIISGEVDLARKIIAAQYHYFPIDETQVATYPIKTSTVAFAELQEGRGYIASLGDNADGKITIRRIYLAYYDAGVYTEFYQPIVVFEGDRNFVAYVPAVATEYYKQQ